MIGRKNNFTDDRTADEMLGIRSKVIFSARAYKYLCDLIGQSAKSNKEASAFFVGKEVGQTNQIFINYYYNEKYDIILKTNSNLSTC